ncbi:uncharacterized CRM domain-containing protein At3g25440, chloroplastic [Ziziphus jujuba]|uniref:Uncharacterized CRM domain-containing protein At3g25440, chloroplastic n=1 Tax=Ziziphus jujuba TaxID=326968 RepID=A0A9B4JIQ7_ZIZJJ|nr:uncharacterized CRM domain-containing protein At3g25440, chloroplastic [Ziziphus jujuba]
MFASSSITGLARAFHRKITRDSLVPFCRLAHKVSDISLSATFFKRTLACIACMHKQSYSVSRPLLEVPYAISALDFSLVQRRNMLVAQSNFRKWIFSRYNSNTSVQLKTDSNIIKFSIGTHNGSSPKGKKTTKQVKMSKKAKLNELRFYRLKAKKKMNSPNPEVRIRYKLEKAKRKETWLIEKLRKFEISKAPAETYDPEILTEEEKHYLKRTGEKKKHYVPVGRRGVFGGVVLNMHLHWKNHETVKVICRPCKPGQIHEYAEELARLSKGIVIDIKPNNTIIFYRGKNYVQPEMMSPPETLSKNKALEKYKYLQSLEHTSQFIEKLEKELEEYHRHLARYKQGKTYSSQDFVDNKL